MSIFHFSFLISLFLSLAQMRLKLDRFLAEQLTSAVDLAAQSNRWNSALNLVMISERFCTAAEPFSPLGERDNILTPKNSYVSIRESCIRPMSILKKNRKIFFKKGKNRINSRVSGEDQVWKMSFTFFFFL